MWTNAGKVCLALIARIEIDGRLMTDYKLVVLTLKIDRYLLTKLCLMAGNKSINKCAFQDKLK